MNKEMLVKEAIKARKNSYSPYSHFAVGAALLTKDNKIYHGANIENASFPLSMCAERNAIFNAYAQGVKKSDIVALAIVANVKKPVSPCGACRQVISELLNVNTPIYLANLKGEIKETTPKELLPYMFTPKDLKQ